MITATVSEMLLALASNRNTLRTLHVDCPLTEEVHDVIHKLPNLCELSVFLQRGTPLSPLILPNLTDLVIRQDDDGDWLQMFHGTTLGKLEAVTFHSGSERLGGFLEAFEMAALAASAQKTLLHFCLYTPFSWKPNYPSLLPFTQLTNLNVEFTCGDICSSNVDDDIVTDLAVTMRKLETLRLGGPPCYDIPTGVTAKGLAVLAYHCSDLSTLCIHFQVASLSTPPAIPGMAFDGGSTALRRDCALKYLEVGKIPVLEESASMVALTLALIFPCIDHICHAHRSWQKVLNTIRLSRQIVNYSSK